MVLVVYPIVWLWNAHISSLIPLLIISVLRPHLWAPMCSLSMEAVAGIDVRLDMDYSRGSKKTGVGKSEVSYEIMTSDMPLPMTVFRE